MQPNIAGLMVESWWGNITLRFPGIGLDAYVVMPNHFHGNILLDAPDPDQPLPSDRPFLPRIIQWFKSATTHDYTNGVTHFGWPPFPRRLWQRTFYDHIIRDPRDLDRLRAYIAANPSRWPQDPDHPPPPSP